MRLYLHVKKDIKNVRIVNMNMKQKDKNAQYLARLVKIAWKRTIFKQYANSKRKTLKELKKRNQYLGL